MRTPGSVDEVDLYDPDTQEDWYPTYRFLQDEAPVYRVPGTHLYVVTRYDDVLHVLRHQDVFPTGTGMARSEAARSVYEAAGGPRLTPLSTNPPEHRHYRALVDGFFDAEGARRWQPSIERTIDELIGEFEHDGEVELVESFALPLPVRIITEIMGFPADDIPRLKAWSSAWVLPFSGGLTVDQEVWVAEQVLEFQRYIADQVAQRRDRPGDDLLSHLATARLAGDRPLTEREIVSIVDHLYIGGNETTTFAITSAMWIMLREPAVRDALLADRSLVPAFVEEAMRLESPTQGLFRMVARDTELGGVALPAGAVVHVRYGAANRDGRMFDQPDQVDLQRPNLRRHLAFSVGEHHCPGHGLSRLEQRLALEALLDRLPGVRLDPARNDFRHEPGFVLRALQHLHLQWDPPPRPDPRQELAR